MGNIKFEITDEQIESISKLQKKAVIKNHKNRKALYNIKVGYNLSNIHNGINQIIYYIGSIAEGQMAQNGMLKTSLQNLEVEINKLKKITKKSDGNE